MNSLSSLYGFSRGLQQPSTLNPAPQAAFESFMRHFWVLSDVMESLRVQGLGALGFLEAFDGGAWGLVSRNLVQTLVCTR